MKKAILLFLIGLSFGIQAQNIHIFVALCDNVNQGIVPKAIGNGQDPANNLYWGCGYGIKTYFTKSAEWKVIKTIKKPSANILERILFKHKTNGSFLLADAYDGAKIKECTIDFFKASSGDLDVVVEADSVTKLNFGGKASLLSYIGHDGLMDFTIEQQFPAKDSVKRDVIILACYSKSYFSPILQSTKANPLVWTTNLMCPEAYTVKAAIDGWLLNETAQQIRTRAAQAYSKYQNCSEKAAKGLLVTGW